MKTILFLGAAHFQMPPIEYAVKQGHYTITLDNQAQNPGHTIAHKNYKNISTLDKDKVLAIAEKEKIDGIVSYASDVGMPTAAYVANCMGLQGSAMSSIDLLVNKAKFRCFLQEQGLQNHFFTTITSSTIKEKRHNILAKPVFPLIVKPTDRSGSRGVSIVHNQNDLTSAIEKAYSHSIKKEVIVETYFEKIGRQLCGDGYMEAGQLKFIAFGDGYFYDDTSYMAPYAETFPSVQPANLLAKVKGHLATILQKAGYLNGPFNFDVIVKKNGDIFVIEIGPRCGGNFIPLLIDLKYGINLTAAAVNLALDKDFRLPQPADREFPNALFAGYMVHTLKEGTLGEVTFDRTLKPYLYYYHPFLKEGMTYEPYKQGNHAIGNVIMKFEDRVTMEKVMQQIQQLIVVN